MRKNVLFIARFDNVLKGTNAILAKTFNMQMCPPTPEMLDRTLDVIEMDLVLFYLSGLSAMQIIGLCNKLAQAYLKAPIVVFGTDEECEDFERCHPDIKVREYLHRPITVPKIVESLCVILDVETETAQPPDSTPDSTSDSTSDTTSDSTPNMSIADFADSLGTDDRRCVLVVDDSGVILRAMKMLLEKSYRVNLANSAKSALESIKRDRPDAILLDYEMPVFNGRELLKLIRNNHTTKDLPVFFLTGVSDKERIKEVISLKPQGYFLKTSNPNIILDALDIFFKNL